MKKCLLLTALILGPVLAFFGCNSSPNRNDPVVQSVYRLEGLLVADPNQPSTIVAIQTTRNDSILTSGSVTFGGDTLAYGPCPCPLGSLYNRSASSATAYVKGQHIISFQDSTRFSMSEAITLADSFVITSINPPNEIPLKPSESARMEWSISTGASNFILASTPRDSAYSGYGYSAYAPSSPDIIPYAAFFPGDSLVPETGWYYVYVYSLTGSPDAGMASKLLPVPLPDQLPDNISSGDLAGRFGTVTVTYRDSILVAFGP